MRYDILDVMAGHKDNPYVSKKILITQNALQRIQGSESVVFELANYLKESGAEVKVYTWRLGEPMKSIFKSAGIEVTTNGQDDFFLECDYVWVHHQVLPEKLVEHLGDSSGKMPKFIFFHMSAMPDLYLEQPYIYALERKIASKVLFVSAEAREMLTTSHLIDNLECPTAIFANPAPPEFANLAPSRPKLKKILVVSNHVPQEIAEARDLLLTQGGGIEIESLGEKEESYARVTADLLNDYDIVVTIGKTVQYCLVAGKPVYVYDKFGGPGYLDEQSFDLAARNNFSGRGFPKKTAAEIVDELITKYNQTLEFAQKNVKKFQKTYLLPNVLPEVFRDLQSRYFDFDEEYLKYVMIAEKAMQEKVIYDWEYVALQEMYQNERMAHQKTMEHAKNLQDNNTYLEFQLDNALQFRGSRHVKRLLNTPHRLINKISRYRTRKRLSSKKHSHLKFAQQFGWHEYKSMDDQLFLVRDDFVKPDSDTLSVLTRIRNEELLLPDTLKYLSEHSQYIFVYDDDSDDKTFELLCQNPNVKLIIVNLRWRSERIVEETRSRGVLLDEAKKHSDSQWFWYTDADERILDDSIRDYLNNTSQLVDGVRMRLFDAYMTKNDQNAYQVGDTLENFRLKFGPEYRDILTFFRNKDYITYQGLDAREPVGTKKVITHFYCQHYGKALSHEQWRETCEYYMNNFGEPYKTKWENRLDKAVHEKSDWGEELYNWGDDLFRHEKKLV